MNNYLTSQLGDERDDFLRRPSSQELTLDPGVSCSMDKKTSYFLNDIFDGGSVRATLELGKLNYSIVLDSIMIS